MENEEAMHRNNIFVQYYYNFRKSKLDSFNVFSLPIAHDSINQFFSKVLKLFTGTCLNIYWIC